MTPQQFCLSYLSGRRHAIRWAVAAFWVGACLVQSAVAGADEQYLVIDVREGQTLRGIAAEYLDDPDLWQEILRVNGLDSPVQVRPGVRLKIPRTQVSMATEALDRSQLGIQEASRQGAKVFAPDLLGHAVRLRDEALSRRKVSDWEGCHAKATESVRQATHALERTRAARDSAGQAVLSGRAGTVQSRKARDLVWNEADRGSLLVEQQKVRTLSTSQAEILFLDESRLRLGANSQAVIRKMRVDRLNNHQEASVSLVEGDVFALLGSSGSRKAFDVEVSGVTTDSASTDFWVSRKGKTTKFANYDIEEMRVESGGEAVVLSQNQGALVESGLAPIKRELLPAPVPTAPEDEHVVVGDEVELSWQPVSKARFYRVEIGGDQSFRNLVLSRTRVAAAGGRAGTGETLFMWWESASPRSQWEVPEGGAGGDEYFWRVAAVDELGFPGSPSEVRSITLGMEEGAPFLVIRSPAEASIVRTPAVTFEGDALSGAVLEVNGTPVEIDDEGAFRVELPLHEGANSFELEARNENGQTTRRQRSLVFMPDREAGVVYDSSMVRVGPDMFAARRDRLQVAGRTTPGARVDVRSVSSRTSAGTFVDPSGEFSVSVPVSGREEAFNLEVTAQSGYVTTHRFVAVRDDEGPVIELFEAPPDVTASPDVRLRGRIAGASEVRLDGRAVSLRDGLFEETVELRQGVNRLVLVAMDAVGNESRSEVTVTLDGDPPELVETSLSPSTVGGGGTVGIAVRARDLSGMRRTADFAVKVGTFVHNGALLLDPEAATYRGTVTVPVGVGGRALLLYVILEDRNGNRRTYRPR